MRGITLISTITVGIAVLFYGCNSPDTTPAQQMTLKQSLNSGVDQVKTAIGQIKSSKGYQVLSINDGSPTTGGRTVGTVDTLLSINMDMIKGVYEYMKDTTKRHWHMPFYSHFMKTGDNDQFIIKMPEALATHPWHFNFDKNSDSTYANNFVVTTSAFKYLLKGWWSYQYMLNSDIDVDDTPAGSIMINSVSNSKADYSYESTYDFGNDYKLGVSAESGDTTKVSYTLMQNDQTLFMEAYDIMTQENAHHPAVNYSLTIGNVMIKRNSTTDSVQVYLDNTLQTNASIDVIYTQNDSTDDHSIFHHKDIQITFDDGTTTTISDLLGNTLGDMATLFADLRNVYFTTNMVNYVAFHAAYGG